MAYCVKCGAKVEDGTMSCPQCGAPIPDLTGGYSGGRADGSRTEYGRPGGQEYTYQSYDSQGYGNQGSYGFQSFHSQTGYQTQYFGTATHFDPTEVRQNKVMGVLSYLGILVLIPLIAGNKQSQYVKHHVNQGLVLYILSVIIDFIEGDWLWGWNSFFRFGGGIFSWFGDIIDLAVFILLVMGIVTACRGERRELPIIGKIKFFK